MPYATRNVGRYEILRPLGRGGMASVHLARQVDLDRLVALKELRALRAEEPSVAQRFLRESRLAGGLSHPNIVTVFDYFEWDGTPFIAMEYVVGGALRPYVGTLSRPQIIGVCEDLLGGLAYAHRNGVVHRDIKPENLMVTSVGRVKIADFGIAKATDRIHTEGFRTSTGMTVGTPAYMAPEQAMAQDVGPWTDLYSVGCLVYELLVGAVPFADTDAPMAMLLRHINEPPRPVRAADPGVSSRLSDWVARLLAKVPSERTGSAEAAWDELEEIADDELGSRWRRSARLGDPASAAAEAGPGGSPASPGVAGPWTPPPAHAVPEPLASIESSLLGSADGEAPDTGTSFVTFVPPPPPGPPLPAPADRHRDRAVAPR